MEENVKPLHKQGDLTISEILPLFFNADAILESPTKLYRIDDGGNRFYYTFDWENWKPEYYISITALLNKTMPTPGHLLRWYAEHGWDKATAITNEKAEYGTMMHRELSQLLIFNQCDLDSLNERVKQFMYERGLDYSVADWTIELKKDILAFAKFIEDYDVKPLCIEGHMVSRDTGIAMVLDLVCEMNAQCYTDKTELAKRKRIRAVIDYKSGKSGNFYESHEIQLEAGKQIWEENFPGYPVDAVYNWAPKDWKKEPTYTLTNQTGRPSAQKLPLLLELAKIDELKPSRFLKVMHGTVKLGQPTLMNWTLITVDEFVKLRMSKMGEKKEPAPAENEMKPGNGLVLHSNGDVAVEDTGEVVKTQPRASQMANSVKAGRIAAPNF